jgi:hypothetical protein
MVLGKRLTQYTTQYKFGSKKWVSELRSPLESELLFTVYNKEKEKTKDHVSLFLRDQERDPSPLGLLISPASGTETRSNLHHHIIIMSPFHK